MAKVEFRGTPPSPIRDIVHDYIRTTKLETYLIDTPEFQRLRDILQNSTAYLTFPCNNNTRFAHSLGVMHLAGKMFVASLKNAESAVLKSFLDEANNLISHYAGIGEENREEKKAKLHGEWKKHLGNVSRFSHNPELFGISDLNFCDEVVTGGDAGFSGLFIVNTLWQVTRLGALVHDFGHLPMSHLFEHAIESTESLVNADQDIKEKRQPGIFESCMDIKEATFYGDITRHARECQGRLSRDLYTGKITDEIERKYHESLGFSLFSKLYHGKQYDEYSELIKELTVTVLATMPHAEYLDTNNRADELESKRLSFLSFIHSIFDNSFVDADRLDYSLRDPISSGSELGAFDLERVVNSCTLTKENGIFRLAHNYKSIGAIESFFFQRNTTYTNIIYHHSILRMNAVVERIIRDLIIYFDTHYQNKSLDPIVNTLLEFNFFSLDENNNCRFMHKKITQYDESWFKTLTREVFLKCDDMDISCFSGNNSDIEKLKLLISTFLDRKVDKLISVWKTSADFQQDFDLSSNKLATFNKSFKDNKYKYDDLIKELGDEIEGKGITFIESRIKPPKFSTNPLFLTRGGEPSKKTSITLDSINNMADTQLTINIFLVGDKIKDGNGVTKFGLECINVIKEKFSFLVNDVISKS
jgi:HD superfamily phosphohydrolase